MVATRKRCRSVSGGAAWCWWCSDGRTDEGTCVRPLQVVGISAHETKSIVLTLHRDGGCSCNIKTANKSIETVTEFKHLETALAYQSSIYEETKLHYEKLYDL